jgi:hypothetical protein
VLPLLEVASEESEDELGKECSTHAAKINVYKVYVGKEAIRNT